MKAALALAVLLAACGRTPAAPVAENAGAALERVAVARGIVADAATVAPVGLYASETDRLCLVPAADGYRIGASVDYGEGQACLARGTATKAGAGGQVLAVRFDDACRFAARVEGDRLRFPATLPAACDRYCTGRASLAALSADRVSASSAEASSAVATSGARLCAR